MCMLSLNLQDIFGFISQLNISLNHSGNSLVYAKLKARQVYYNGIYLHGFALLLTSQNRFAGMLMELSFLFLMELEHLFTFSIRFSLDFQKVMIK